MNPSLWRHLALATVFLFLSRGIWSQSTATEYWEGSRSSAGKSASINLRVERPNSSERAAVDLPDYGALDIPVSRFSMADGRVHFELVGDVSTTVFDGIVVADSIRGTWSEGDRKGEFDLRQTRRSLPGSSKEEVSFQNGDDVRLMGTLALPSSGDRAPAIVFVHGSGPEARNASSFMAQFFVQRGVAALIYDKRGTGVSTGDWRHSSFENLAGDVIAAVHYLKNRKEIDPTRIGLMGSSQGGWVAPIAASQSPDIHFVIAKSAAGVTPEEQELARVEIQMRASGNSSGEIEHALALYRMVIAYARSGQDWDELSAALKAGSQKSWYFFSKVVPKDWWYFDQIRLTFGHDPIPVLHRMKVPLLVILGGKDTNGPLQRSLARMIPALSASGKRSLIEIFPNAGHDLRVVPDKGEPWDFPRFAPGYLDFLASWVKLQTGTAFGKTGDAHQ